MFSTGRFSVPSGQQNKEEEKKVPPQEDEDQHTLLKDWSAKSAAAAGGGGQEKEAPAPVPSSAGLFGGKNFMGYLNKGKEEDTSEEEERNVEELKKAALKESTTADNTGLFGGKGVIGYYKDKQEEKRRQEEEEETEAQNKANVAYSYQRALLKHLEDSLRSDEGRVLVVSREDILEDLQSYKDRVSHFFSIWQRKERRMGYGTALTTTLVVPIIGLGASATAGWNIAKIYRIQHAIHEALPHLNAEKESPAPDASSASLLETPFHQVPVGVSIGLHPLSFNGICDQVFLTPSHRQVCNAESRVYTDINQIKKGLEHILQNATKNTGLSGIEVERMIARALKDVFGKIDLTKNAMSEESCTGHRSIEVRREKPNTATHSQYKIQLTNLDVHFSVQVRHACFMRSSEFSMDLTFSMWTFDSFAALREHAKPADADGCAHSK